MRKDHKALKDQLIHTANLVLYTIFSFFFSKFKMFQSISADKAATISLYLETKLKKNSPQERFDDSSAYKNPWMEKHIFV